MRSVSVSSCLVWVFFPPLTMECICNSISAHLHACVVYVWCDALTMLLYVAAGSNTTLYVCVMMKGEFV